MAALCGVVLHRFAKLSLIRCSEYQAPVRTFINSSGPLFFRPTAPLQSEPMKKKKKMDMSIIVGREQKKRRKLEKAIRKQESKGLKLKPIEEIEGDRSVLKTLDKRKRDIAPLSFDESERRALLHKDWSRYRTRQFQQEMSAVRQAITLQSRALLELRQESEQLYQQAIQELKGVYCERIHQLAQKSCLVFIMCTVWQTLNFLSLIDDKLIPFEFRGPAETPPIKGYIAKDGDYIDTTKKFDK